MTNHVIICGLGHIGFRCFELIHRLGVEATVITDNASDDWQRKVESCGGVLFIGDARSDELLIKAGIASASAILAVTDQDLANVSIAMDARRLNSNIKIICRLFDTHLGEHICDALDIHQIFSTSEIAAPAFCDAIEDPQSIHRVSVDGQRLMLFESSSIENSILNVDEDGNQFGLHIHSKPERSKVKLSLPRKLKDWILRPSLVKFRRILTVLIGLVTFAVIVIKYQMSLSWVNAFYFVTTTVTTVGYGDFNFSTTSVGMKIFGMILMVGGTTGLAILFSIVADTMLTEKFSSLFGGHPVPRNDHVVLVGGDHIGVRIAEELTAGETQVVAIDDGKMGRFPANIKIKIAVVEGDPRNETTLKKANIESAKAILMVSDGDIENLSVGLTAQKLSPRIQTIARIFDADLSEKLQKKLSIQKILSVSRLAAPYFVAATLAPHVVGAFCWRNHLVVVSEKVNPNDGSFAPLKINAADIYIKAIPLSLR